MENSSDRICSTEADEIITPDEYLKRQLDQEAEAIDALPGVFNECTFNLGPLNQPIYVCLTCKEDASVKEKGPAGICYSCSISCHADHELLELFNKRDSICECGTKKFPIKCTLEKGICSVPKDSAVEHSVDSEGWRKTVTSNNYTHNHDGLYCWCDKTYDPEIEEDTMVQCLDCQDWFHQRCIGDYDPEDDSDFICSTCVLAHPALLLYITRGRLSAVYRPKEPQGEIKDTLPSSVSDKPDQSILNESASVNALTGVKRPNEDTELPPSSKPRLEVPEDAEEETCSKPKLISTPTCDNREFSLIGKKDWRNDLCRCEKCLDMYYAQGMLHLIDVEDVYTPEEDPNRDVSLHDAGLQALGALPHDRAILLASRYDQLRSTIRNFLEPFAKSGKTITKEDIMKHFNSSRDP